MANESGHYIERCKHGKVLSQCRCPGPKTEYTIECNPELCPPAAMANDDVIECSRCSLPIHRNDARDYLGNRVAHRHERCIGLLREALRASRARVAELEQDARRLDWLGRPTRILTVFDSGSHMTADRGEILTRTSLRELIDAAALSAEDGREKGGE